MLRLRRKLAEFLAEPIDSRRAREIIQVRMANRDAVFLDGVKRVAFSGENHPYQFLLEQAGYDFGRLEALVKGEGLDAALRTLYQAGVYVEQSIFKRGGKLTRHGATMEVEPAAFDSPFVDRTGALSTSGSSGQPTELPDSIEHLELDAALNNRSNTLATEAREFPPIKITTTKQTELHYISTERK